MPALSGVRIAFVVANEGVESIELTAPWDAARALDASTFVVAPTQASVQLMDHIDKAGTVETDLTTAAADVSDFDAVVLPGGVVNADELRTDAATVRFLHGMVEAGKPIAVICHGSWSLIEAGVVEGRTLTSWPSLRTDITNAGGTWVDEQVVVCSSGPNTIISSRRRDDIPSFVKTFTDVFTQYRESRPSDDDLVDEAGMESFPSSDPAAFTPR